MLFFSVLLRRKRYLFVIFSFILLFSFSGTFLGLPWIKHSTLPAKLSGQAIVSLASSHTRLDTELPITVLSLTRQTVAPKEIRIYFPEGEKDDVQKRVAVSFTDGLGSDVRPLSEHLLHPLVKIMFTEDIGPATKFVPIIGELLGKVDGGLDQPVIVVDDDHYYSSSLVATLMATHLALPSAALGFRGWRIRQDLHWGVSSEELDRHVQYGWRLARPYRVGVLTANEGYLVVPRFFVPPVTLEHLRDSTPPSHTSLTTSVPLVDAAMMASTGHAHLVDDIWMAGCLSSQLIPRYIVPLPGPPSLDVTDSHPLEAHMSKDGTDRATANDEMLRAFGDAWKKEGIWYRFARDVRKAKGVVVGLYTEEEDEPVWIGPLARVFKEAQKLTVMARLRVLFKDIRFN